MMTPTDNLFKSYLLPIMEAQKAANDVAYVEMSEGDGMDRMLEDSRSETVYPGIFLLRPKYTTRRIDNFLLQAVFNTTFYVWVKGKLDDRVAQEAAYTKAKPSVVAKFCFLYSAILDSKIEITSK